ncbi:sperm microtubule associated protein 1-like [Lineus longissimus]|uniref:sperm microtubule associated protein 1-like n=1 Tax=Lineus longissimus TaxID=88925 RepID=UPI00315D8DF5
MSEIGSQKGSEAGSKKSEKPLTKEEREQEREERRKRLNKIYRCPPTPPPEFLLAKEKTFVLDNNATSSISNDYSKANPKLGPVIPPYLSRRDKHVRNYFHFVQVPEVLEKTGQMEEKDGKKRWVGSSIEGVAMDKFHSRGAGYLYLKLRNDHGAGHSRESIDGHAQFMQGIKPAIGWHGSYGYRRTTPWLRREPSQFGIVSRSACHEAGPSPR